MIKFIKRLYKRFTKVSMGVLSLVAILGLLATSTPAFAANPLLCFADAPGTCLMSGEVATLNTTAGGDSGVYTEVSSLNGKTLTEVGTNQLSFRYTGTPGVAGSPRISLPIDTDGNGTWDSTTEGYAFIGAKFCTSDINLVDPINDPNCKIFFGADVGGYTGWTAFVAAFPSAKIGSGLPFVIADDVGTWTVSNVQLGSEVADNVVTNTATVITSTSVTVNGTNGPSAADDTSFWWGTTLVASFSTPADFPASNWSHDSGLDPVSANATFSNNITGLTPNTTYYYVAWSEVGGTWYPGAVQSFITTAAPAPVTPAAPSVTNDDTLNTVTGMTTAMEYKLDTAGYVVYDATAFGLLDFSGAHTLLVRVAAEGINPVSADTTLTFTTNPVPVTAATPSSNDINRTNGWAHVDQSNVGVGTIDLNLIQPRNYTVCFEYRTDGNTAQQTSPTNYNTDITDGLYPYKCLTTTGNFTKTLTANEYVEVRMVFGGETDERFDWTRFDVLPVVSVTPAAPSVTNNDTANTVTGMTTGMEYKLDTAGYVVYDATAFGLLDFSGAHTLLVRVAAEGINPVSADTTLTFTTNPSNNGGGSSGGSYRAIPATKIAGCVPGSGDLFDTTSGKSCTVRATPAGQVLGASIGPIPGCGNRTTGFSIVTGESCVGNSAGKVLGAEKFKFTLFIKNGSNGSEIIELQNFLNTLGDTLVVDGKFGPKTKTAVIKFQIANGLKGDGVVGPITRVVLNK